MNNKDASVDPEFLRRRLDLILAATGDGIYGLDLNSNTTFVNPAAARMSGHTIEEMMGANLHQLIHHTHKDGSAYHVHDCPIYAAVTDGKIHRATDEVFWRKDGSSYPVEYISTPIWDEGKLAGAVVSFRDITQRKQAEARAGKLQTELHHVSRLSAMGEMASAMAHELNQPLTAVMNYIQASRRMLEGDRSDGREQAVDYINKAVAQATRAGEIIRGLRSFVDKSEAEVSFENVNDVIEEAVLLAIPGAERERTQFKAALAQDVPQTLIHKIKIQQVVVNLVRNALEALSETDNARLTITTRKEGSMIEVAIRDNGPGLSQDQLNDVFQSFMTTKKRGMGVGLSICRSIIDDHNGKLWAENNQTGGATFYFTLPVVSGGDEDHD